MRLGSYESKEHQDMVRDLLKGSFQNTAFVVYAPDGKTKLTRSGRGPQHALGREVIESMEKIAKKYKQKGDDKDAILQDFHSFKQSLNVAAADQRLLVLIVAEGEKLAEAQKQVQKVFTDKETIGKFHYDTLSRETDRQWNKKLTNSELKPSFVIVRPDTYGQEGEVIAQLPINSTATEIKTALLKGNKAYNSDEERKTYNEHVKEGRAKGITFENTMPPGEDRDGDGKIDPKRTRK